MSSLKTGMIEFDGIPGFLCQPEVDVELPAVVVLQEWWGLNDHIKDVARRLAEEGFVTLAPDLYRGESATEPDEARKLAMELDRDRAIADIQGAVNYLRDQDFVMPKVVGTLGFCMGGGLSLWMSHAGEHVGASVVFYGGGGAMKDEDVAKVNAPILGLYGEQDGGIPVTTVKANEAKLHDAGKTADFIIYPDAPHAFFNDTRPSYRPDAAASAWGEAIHWLEKYLIDEVE